MPSQDLTPQLRTRLNRMERAVGLFIIVATALLAAGFSYYLYNAALRQGWFQLRTVYTTFADSGEGLHEGDAVLLMGFPVGHITHITPSRPRGKGSDHNVMIEFEVVGTNYNYIWVEGSTAKFESSFLGTSKLNVTRGKGTNQPYTIYLTSPLKQMTLEEIRSSPHLDQLHLGQEIYSGSNRLAKAWISVGLTNQTWVSPLGVTNQTSIRGQAFPNLGVIDFAKMGLKNVWVIDRTGKPKNAVTGVWNDKERRYEPYEVTNAYCLTPDEAPTLNDRAQAMVAQVQAALPSFLALTNQISQVLSNSANLTARLDGVAMDVRPVITNLAVITANLKDPNGSLGQWVIPTNLNVQLAGTLLNANGTLTNVNTNLVMLADQVGRSLESLANITSNLNAQVQDNSNILTHISDIIVHSDQFVQGLERHWLLRSAFKKPKTNAPASKPAHSSAPFRSPRESDH